MEQNIQQLINNINDSNLSEKDKKTLIEILSAKKIDINKLANTCITIFKVGKEALKLFDIDLGDN